MKTTLRRACFIAGVVFAGIMMGCQNEEIPEAHNHLDIEIKRKSFKQFNKLPELVTKALPADFGQSTDLGRGTTDPLYDFKIDSTSVTEIVKDGKTFYTMEVTRENHTGEDFENLVIEEGGGNRAHLFKYYPSAAYLEELKTNVHAQYSGGLAITELDSGTLMSRGGCTTITIAFCGNGPRGTLAGPGCYDNHDGGAHVYTLSFEICNDGDPDNVVQIISPANGTSSPASGGGTSGSGSGTGIIGGNISPDPNPDDNPDMKSIVTEPVLNFPAVKAFRNGLITAQKNWWNDPENAAEVNALIDELNVNNSPEGIAFVQGMLESMMNNDGYSGDSELGDSDPDNTDYNGPTQHIPSIITLDDGSTVSVTFGTTSDGVNADQDVADDVVEAIIHALNEANDALPVNQKITSIHISATTNGKHGVDSNHYKKTAVDISRINGKKMIHLGPNNQVAALQNGFQSYDNIRENFGPVLKAKTFPNGAVLTNLQIGGHQDHIHISVQN